jgi:hypothetical protein
MPYRCDHCHEEIIKDGFDWVVLIGGSNEASPELVYHACCAIKVLTGGPSTYPVDRCCETHWLESK